MAKCLQPLDFSLILCHTTYMIKTNNMTDFPTNSELRELEAEVDDTLTLECDDWVDAMMSDLVDINY